MTVCLGCGARGTFRCCDVVAMPCDLQTAETIARHFACDMARFEWIVAERRFWQRSALVDESDRESCIRQTEQLRESYEYGIALGSILPWTVRLAMPPHISGRMRDVLNFVERGPFSCGICGIFARSKVVHPFDERIFDFADMAKSAALDMCRVRETIERRLRDAEREMETRYERSRPSETFPPVSIPPFSRSTMAKGMRREGIER